MKNIIISEIDSKIEATVKLLKSLDFVHSILLFGSISKKSSGNDIDICYIPSREMNLKERLAINSAVPAGVDISMYFDLPVHIRKRVTRRACERTFQLACEDVIDICNLRKRKRLWM